MPVQVYPKFKLKFPFEIMKMGDESVAVAVEDGVDSFHGLIKLQNESAVFLMNKIQNWISEPELIEACMNEYPGTDKKEAAAVVREFLIQFVRQDLLDADRQNGYAVPDEA